MLGDRGDLADVLLQALRARGDLLRDGGDLLDPAGDVLDRFADLLERLAGPLDDRGAVRGALGTALDDCDRVAGLGLDRADQP